MHKKSDRFSDNVVSDCFFANDNNNPWILCITFVAGEKFHSRRDIIIVQTTAELIVSCLWPPKKMSCSEESVILERYNSTSRDESGFVENTTIV